MSVRITASVGAEARNRAADAKAVQAALKRLATLMLDPRLDPGPVDGAVGDGTEGAIERFQRRLGARRPDARMDPDGQTLRRLNAWLRIGDARLTYPFARKSAVPFHGADAGMRAFGARRSSGARAHAGIDVYFPDFTPVLSMADGVVTRGPYPFYADTHAVEIDHGAVLARYGEIAPDSPSLVKKGERVKQGQKIGRVGILKRKDGSRLGVPSMMLHLELYDKTERGRLTRKKGTSARDPHGRPFFRRRDLVDPTGFVHRAALPDA